MKVCLFVKLYLNCSWCGVLKQVAYSLSCRFFGHKDQIAAIGESCSLSHKWERDFFFFNQLSDFFSCKITIHRLWNAQSTVGCLLQPVLCCLPVALLQRRWAILQCVLSLSFVFAIGKFSDWMFSCSFCEDWIAWWRVSWVLKFYL